MRPTDDTDTTMRMSVLMAKAETTTTTNGKTTINDEEESGLQRCVSTLHKRNTIRPCRTRRRSVAALVVAPVTILLLLLIVVIARVDAQLPMHDDDVAAAAAPVGVAPAAAAAPVDNDWDSPEWREGVRAESGADDDGAIGGAAKKAAPGVVSFDAPLPVAEKDTKAPADIDDKEEKKNKKLNKLAGLPPRRASSRPASGGKPNVEDPLYVAAGNILGMVGDKKRPVVVAADRMSGKDGGKGADSRVRLFQPHVDDPNEDHTGSLDPTDPHLADEQRAFAEDHRGHEQQHAMMSLILFGSLVVSQLVALLWQKAAPKSYNMFSLIGFWLIPGGLAVYAGHTRFVVVWIVFSLLNLIVIRSAMARPISRNAPRLVYGWYTWIHRITSVVSMFGGVIFFLGMFHAPLVIAKSPEQDSSLADWALIVAFYGVYFGTLARDCVERLSERMATTLGYYSKGGIPEKYLRHGLCAICGLSTSDTGGTTSGPAMMPEELSRLYSSDAHHREDSSLLRLGCGHVYHNFCIRGWTIIGKKDTCPYCGERVDMTPFKKNPWDITQLLYLRLLDWVRFILVWNPLVFIFVHFIFKIFHLQ